MLELSPVHSPWSPWRTVGIQPRHRWPACLPWSCNCTAASARGSVGGNGRPALSAPCPRFFHPWTSARAPPADWRRRTPWSRPGGWEEKLGVRKTITLLVCSLRVLLQLTVVYWIMTLFSSSGLKSVFFCSVARMCFICPTIQFIVLRKRKKKNKKNKKQFKQNSFHTFKVFQTHWPVDSCVQFYFHLLNHLFLLVKALGQLWGWAEA